MIHFTGYFDSQTMSLSLYDGSFYSGTLDGNIVTFPDSGDWVGLDWVGQITKPKVEDCFQNKLNEYCRNLGVKDNHPVEGEAGLKSFNCRLFPDFFRSKYSKSISGQKPVYLNDKTFESVVVVKIENTRDL